MYMSLLFAVAKLTTVKHENDYPLIFDAPTSSFTAAKESDFFGVIDAKKYRIEKARPFDEKDLSTIQTYVESI